MTKRSEQFFDVLFCFIDWNIFNVNIVDHLSWSFQDIFWNNFLDLIIFNLASQSSINRFRFFKTNKAVISSRVVLINCNFCAHNFTILREQIKKFFVVDLFSFRELYKKIFVVKISSFHNFSIKWQSSTRFSIDIKVPHFFACNSKLFLI